MSTNKQCVHVYPRSKLAVCKGLLMRFFQQNLFCVKDATCAQVLVIRVDDNVHMFLALFGGKGWRFGAIIEGVGLTCVRRIQRWWRLQIWRPRALAFMMATREPKMSLDADLLKLCLSMP